MASYRAFLSYSHSDTSVATWLHHALETYRVPSKLVGRTTGIGVVPRRLRPIFRDRDEFSASADLGAAAHAALDGSDFLIVICSPAAARSRWVNQEIISFKRLHGESRILAVIASGEPYASDDGTVDQECFPASLRFRLGPDGEVSSNPAEPIAADLRPRADGKRLAKLKLVAGLTGLGLDDLIQRETQRRLRRLTIVTASATIGMVFAAGLAVYANARRIEANEQRQVAQQEAATARAASDFLVGTFVLSDPATENPRTITAQTILDRSAQRALSDLSGQPVVQARLIGTLGQAYNNLGLFHEARTMIERSAPSFRKAGPEAVNAELTLAMTYLQLGMLDSALATTKRAERSLGPQDGEHADVRARAAVTEGMVLRAMGEVRPGIAAFRRAITIYRSAGERDALKQSVALMALGNLLSDDGQFPEAESALNQSLAINTRVLGAAHRSTGESWFALAQNAFLSGDLPLAEKRIAIALTIERKMLDPDNPIIADSLSMQGQIFHGQGRLIEAERSLEEAIAIYEKAFGGPHYLIGIAQIYLALVESERGRTGKALAVLDEAKRNYDASYGKLHANHGDLLVNRATILARAGRRKEALADCAAGMKILDLTLGADAAFTRQLGEVCAKI